MLSGNPNRYYVMLVRSFTVNKISGTRHQPRDTQYFLCSFEYCHLLELYVKCAALYRIFIAQAFWFWILDVVVREGENSI